MSFIRSQRVLAQFSAPVSRSINLVKTNLTQNYSKRGFVAKTVTMSDPVTKLQFFYFLKMFKNIENHVFFFFLVVTCRIRTKTDLILKIKCPLTGKIEEFHMENYAKQMNEQYARLVLNTLRP